ncbi:SPOR domain-containing protein [Roseicitreum antarcticum]|uniref:Cell division protein DedD (Protein involved in septation) n=1 Tax=Roseicitreum antarcticum TaxID=564137 RepID=A0A1H2RKK3_9RHOB|nr:SPOR domain-containing protein [Roseicitreum antarcticum]SDW19284.1 Cell division protein DedD (protein involved in septation) [Roseicitreum antarcticum]
MARLRFRQVLGLCALGVALAACDGAGFGSGSDGAEDATSATRAASGAAVERDVEAPQVFNMQDQGLWDGRPSLGGVWVAHPDVRDPERVIIRNPTTGREVVGALFRRERQNPGPVFQVSADAAAAVGMLAGQPAALSVVALRTQAAPEPGPEVAAEAAPDAAQVAETALADANAEPAMDAGADAAAPQVAAAPVPAAEPEAPRRRFWPFGRRAEEPAAPQGIETVTLDAAPQSAASPPVPAAAPPPPPAAAPIDRAYVQLGIFSVEANANRAAAQMRALGLQGNITPGQSGDNRYWRVTVGPAPSVTERDRTLAAVKSEGFSDAYVVSR